MSERVLIDDATIVMRSRFLSASERIISHLSWLEAHAEEIRADVRDSVRASAEKIRITLTHLTDQMDRLPEAEWERFKALLMLLRAQQDVLDSAEALIQKARANVVSRKRSAPEAVATGADEPAGLESALHWSNPRNGLRRQTAPVKNDANTKPPARGRIREAAPIWECAARVKGFAQNPPAISPVARGMVHIA